MTEPTLEEDAERLRVAIEESSDFVTLGDFIAEQMKDPEFRFWWYFYKVWDWPVGTWYKLTGRLRQWLS